MELQVKSITIYVRESQLEQLLTNQDYGNIVWTLTPGDPSDGRFYPVSQVQLQVSLDTYNFLKKYQVA